MLMLVIVSKQWQHFISCSILASSSYIADDYHQTVETVVSKNSVF